MTQYNSVEFLFTNVEKFCLTLGLIFSDILNLPNNLLLNACFMFMYVQIHNDGTVTCKLLLCEWDNGLFLDLLMLIPISL